MLRNRGPRSQPPFDMFSAGNPRFHILYAIEPPSDALLVDKRAVLLVIDGMADRPLIDHDYKTPLEYANTPNMDRLAKVGCQTRERRGKPCPTWIRPIPLLYWARRTGSHWGGNRTQGRRCGFPMQPRNRRR
ncbi:hypothetical protein E6H29_10605 [Candidatus Bathyarchaeota archaeon]|nr:MAG: hypothetical protein E6H29_10605 [Candidatus Bathyarchaeota archaeon]